MPRQRAYYQNFPEGVVNTIPAEQISDQAVKDAVNMEFDRQSNFRVRPGLVRYQKNQNLYRADRNDFSVPPWSKTVTTTLTPGEDGPGLFLGEATEASVPGGPTRSDFMLKSYTTVIGERYTFSIAVQIPSVSTTLVAIEAPVGGLVFGRHTDCADTAFAYAPIAGTDLPSDVRVERIEENWYRASVSFVATGVSSIITIRPGAASRVGPLASDPTAMACQLVDGELQTTIAIDGSGFYSNPIPAYVDAQAVNLWDATLSSGHIGCVRSYGDEPNNADVDPADFTTSRITSIYQFTDSTGNTKLYFTSGDEGWRYADNPESWSKKWSFNPIDTNVQWVTYDGQAFIAVRGDGVSDAELYVLADAGAGTTPTLVTDPVSTTTVRPKPRFIEAWNDRLWIVDDEEPNLVHCSKLGDGSDWSDLSARTGAATFEIGNQENEPVTGLKAHNGKLFIFKRDKIYIIDAAGSTGAGLTAGQYLIDLTTMSTRLWSSELGCLSGYTILPVKDDLVFLSAYGLASMAASDVEGGLERSILSQNVAEFHDLNVESETAYAVTDPINSQYIIMFPTGTSTTNNQCWVMDYEPNSERGGSLAFMRWDTGFHASCLARFREGGRYRFLVGGYSKPGDNGLARVYLFRDDSDVWADDCQAYLKRIITKAFTLGDSLLKKRYHRYHLRAELLTNSLNLNVCYRYNQDSSRDTNIIYKLREGLTGGARFGIARFTDLLNNIETRFALPRPTNRSIRQRVHGREGRYGQSIQFLIFTSNPEESFVLKELSFYYSPSNERYIDEY